MATRYGQLAIIFFGLITFATEFGDCQAVEAIPKSVTTDIYISETRETCVNADVGRVEAGLDYEVSIQLQNKTGRDVRFDDVDLTCNCQSFEPKSGLIREGDFLTCRLKFKVPATPQESQSGGSFRLVDGGQTAINMGFGYRVADYVGFEDSMVSVEIAEGKEQEAFTAKLVHSDSADLDE